MIELKLLSVKARAGLAPKRIQRRIVAGRMMSSTRASRVGADTFRIAIYVRSVK